MTIDPKNPRHLIADEGMVIRRIEDQFIFGFELIMAEGAKAEDFEEIPCDPSPEPNEE